MEFNATRDPQDTHVLNERYGYLGDCTTNILQSEGCCSHEQNKDQDWRYQARNFFVTKYYNIMEGLWLELDYYQNIKMNAMKMLP